MTQLVNLIERSLWTGIQSFAASVVLTNSLGWTDLKIAAGAAVLSVLKNLSIDSTVRGQLDVLNALNPKGRKR